MATETTKKEFEYKVIKEIGTLSESPNEKGYDKVVSVISWNGGKPKLDIRMWNKDRSKMGKGVSLSCEECYFLRDILNDDNNLEKVE